LQQRLLSIPEFIGHLHPVLVHLPIGILLLACLFLWQSRKDQSEQLQKTINIILCLGMISAIASCITGYILSRTGDYDEEMVGWHQWMGISVAMVSILVFYFRRKQSLRRWQSLMATILLLLIIITGHLGGSLTHGSGYLTQPLETLSDEDSIAGVRKPILQIQEALAYADVIQPILQYKCYSCHSARRQKGKLRLDKPEFIQKGGKDGVIIVAGNSANSELMKRILLPRDAEHHMAPKEKPQLTESERSIIRWWIDQGADYSKKVKELLQPDKIKPLLNALQSGNEEKKALPEIPSIEVEKADAAALIAIRNLGALVMPVAQNSNYLDASFITTPAIHNADMALLLPIKKQLVWLKLSDNRINDSSLVYISKCFQITRLQLDHTGITDQGLGQIGKLDSLQVLNLVGTRISAAGLIRLKGLRKLKSIYLYQTNIKKEDWTTLKAAFPKVALDSGGYQVPLFETDTIIVKPRQQPH
jgi:uncharacterized membrane protein